MEIVPRYRFEALVADALDDLPDDLLPVLDNVVVQVRDEHPDEPELLGLYEGTPHTERLGAVEIPRKEYLRRLAKALRKKVTFGDKLECV